MINRFYLLMQTVQMMHEILWLWWKIYSLFIRVQSNKGGLVTQNS